MDIKIEYKEITTKNFGDKSLPEFDRYQYASHVLKNINGKSECVPLSFVEDWNESELRNREQQVLRIIQNGFGFMAVIDSKVKGFAVVSKNPIGEKGEYIELCLFHVSREYRKQGIGKKLFTLVVEEARKCGAQKLYISASDAYESQKAYEKLGCVTAQWVYKERAEEEPTDIPLEYKL